MFETTEPYKSGGDFHWRPEPCGAPPTAEERRANERAAPCTGEARYIVNADKRRAVACPDHLTRVIERETNAAPSREVRVQKVGF